MTALERAPTNTLLVTTDYTTFKKLKPNREISLNHVQKLADAIQKKNLLVTNPIMVNPDMEVIDGQHRLKAAELLGLPIYYIITADIVDEDIILLNTARKNWTADDYCDFYVAKGNKNYKLLRDYCQLYEVPLHIFLSATRKQLGAEVLKKFREGMYKFPEGEDLKKAVEALEFKTEIIGELSSLVLPMAAKRVIKGHAFERALLPFLLQENCIPRVLKDKLRIQAEKIKVCPSQHGYYTMLKEMYNWKNKCPID